MIFTTPHIPSWTGEGKRRSEFPETRRDVHVMNVSTKGNMALFQGFHYTRLRKGVGRRRKPTRSIGVRRKGIAELRKGIAELRKGVGGLRGASEGSGRTSEGVGGLHRAPEGVGKASRSSGKASEGYAEHRKLRGGLVLQSEVPEASRGYLRQNEKRLSLHRQSPRTRQAPAQAHGWTNATVG